MEPYIQKTNLKSPETDTLVLYSYQGGLNNVNTDTTMQQHFATNVLNMEFLKDGLIQKRCGTKRIDQNDYTGTTFIDTFSPSGEVDKRIIATNNKLFVDGVQVCTLNGAVRGVAINNAYWFVDGKYLRTYEKVDGVWKVFIIKRPTNLEDTLAEKATKDSDTIKVTDGSKFKAGMWIQIGEQTVQQNQQVQTVSPANLVKVLSVSDKTIKLGEKETEDFYKVNATTGDRTLVTEMTEVPTRLEYDYPVGTKIILFGMLEEYKYIGDWKTGTETIDGVACNTKWYEPCTHELEDAFLGVNLIPENPSFICYSKNRLILSGIPSDPQTIYISEVNNPYYCPVGLGVSLPPNGDKVTGLTSFHDSLVITRQDDIHVLYGNTNKESYGELFKLKRINTHTGCTNGNTIKVVNSYMFYLGTDGVVYKMHTTNTDVNLLATSVLSQTINLLLSPLSFTFDEMKKAISAYNNDYYYLSIGDRVLVYSYRFMAWTVFDRINPIAMHVHDNKLIWVNTSGKLMEFDETTYLDDGMGYSCKWESKLFDLGYPIHYKYFKYISLVFDVYENFLSSAKIVFEIDYEDVELTQEFVNQISRWGKAKWDENVFGLRNINKSVPAYVGRRGRLVKVKVKNGYDFNMQVKTVANLPETGINVGTAVYVSDTHQFFVRAFDEEKYTAYWRELLEEDVNQPLKLYNVEIEYSLRGRR